jgi:hypothetical protein
VAFESPQFGMDYSFPGPYTTPVLSLIIGPKARSAGMAMYGRLVVLCGLGLMGRNGVRMAGSLWALVGLNWLAASVLIVSGVAKLVSPRQLLRAVKELSRRDGGLTWLTTSALRALRPWSWRPLWHCLCQAQGRRPGCWSAHSGGASPRSGSPGGCGRSTAACGCLGRYSDRPLGLRSAVVGLAIASVLPVNQLIVLPAADGRAYAQRGVVATALGSLLLCLWANRQLILTLLRPAGASARTVVR